MPRKSTRSAAAAPSFPRPRRRFRKRKATRATKAYTGRTYVRPGSGLPELGLSPREILGLAHAVHRYVHWICAKAGRNADVSATWLCVYELAADIDAFYAFRAAHPGFNVTAEDEAAAEEIIARAAAGAAASSASLGDDAGYVVRLADTLSRHVVPSTRFAMTCSAVFAYRTLSRHGEHIGTPGARTEFDLTLRYVTPCEFKVPRKRRPVQSYRLGFTDPAGNTVVWFSSRAPESLGLALENSYALRATVKSHREFRGYKQTFVTRGCVLKAVA
jgi:hypothetical protein